MEVKYEKQGCYYLILCGFAFRYKATWLQLHLRSSCPELFGLALGIHVKRMIYEELLLTRPWWQFDREMMQTRFLTGQQNQLVGVVLKFFYCC